MCTHLTKEGAEILDTLKGNNLDEHDFLEKASTIIQNMTNVGYQYADLITDEILKEAKQRIGR